MLWSDDARPLRQQSPDTEPNRQTNEGPVHTVTFGGTGNRVVCYKAADLGDDGYIAPADLVLLLDLVTTGASTPPAPFPSCGMDPTLDALSCSSGCP